MVKIHQVDADSKIGKALVFSQEDVDYVRNIYKVDDETIRRDVDILKNWIKQQKHLPQSADDEFLERCLLNNKFRVENTKRKLDDYYTIRGVHKQYFQPDNSQFLPSKVKTILIPLPILTPERHRIIYLKTDPDFSSFNQLDYFKYQNLYYELLLKYDYSSGLIFIYDCEGLTFDHAKSFTVSHFANMYALFKKSYSGRIVRLELINPPKYVNLFMAVFKLAFPEKFYSRFRLHADAEALFQSLPRECLPKEFGGNLESLGELIKSYWDPIFIEHMDFFERNLKEVSDETSRVGEPPNTGLFGVEGTFKELRVD